ncbi:hypothetical protein M8A51_18305 [Schlegelella sp. S2-27]|uniref:Uncharacterized protein n=1 Tax=Caldimonas mangrovi TaxID=2944811 RepID=A0ABT0YUH8_9BURK|nr:hypothetical protein [Caldimonas mangrovi]MCM5681483.1 hypothetical protein [Caldimonas mangrovi]
MDSLPQLSVQVPGYRGDRDAVPDDYRSGKQIQPLGTRRAVQYDRPTVLMEASAVVEAIKHSVAGTGFAEARMRPMVAEVERQFPNLSNHRFGAAAAMVAATAVAASGNGTDPARMVAELRADLQHLDFDLLRQGRLPGVGEGPPTRTSRAVQVLMLLARSAPPGATSWPGAEIAAMLVEQARGAPVPGTDAASLAAMAAEPVNIEFRPAAVNTIQAALAQRLSGAGEAAPQLSPGEQQIAALAIHGACGGDTPLALRVADRLVSYDLGAAMNRGSADALQRDIPVEVERAVQATVRHMVAAGGAAVLAACKLVHVGGQALQVRDARTLSFATEALLRPGVRDVSEAIEEAQRLHQAIQTAAAGSPQGTELQAVGQRDPSTVDLEAGLGSRPGLGDEWPSDQRLRSGGMSEGDIAMRLPALALLGMTRKLGLAPPGPDGTLPGPTLAQKAAMSAVRNGIDAAKLDFANAQSRQLAQWLQRGAGANVVNRRLLGNRLVADPVRPLVEHGPLGSLNNVAVPQLGMKEALPPLTDLMSCLAEHARDAGSASDADLQRDFGRLALLQHWSTQTQGMLGKQVTLLPEQLQQIGDEAARQAGRTGEDARAFSTAVQGVFAHVSLDQRTLREVYDDVARRALLLPAKGPADEEFLASRLTVLDDAVIRGTGAPADYDSHFAADAEKVPAHGRGAMQPGAKATQARDKDRMGALADVMQHFGTSSGLNMTSYGGWGVPDVGTVASTAMKIAGAPWWTGWASPNVVAGYQYNKNSETIVRMGVNASGIEFNYGEGGSRTGTWVAGGGASFKTWSIGGRAQRTGFTVEGGWGGTDMAYKSVFLRVPRTSEAEGGVPGAGAGSSSDSLRTAYLANAMRRFGELLASGEPQPLLSLMAEHDVLSVGVANGDADFNDKVKNEYSVKAGVSFGLGSVGGKNWNLPFTMGPSGGGSYIPEGNRALRIRTHGSTDALRRQDFSQWKSQAGVGANFGGRGVPLVASGTYVPHRGNFPTSLTFMRTEIDGVMHQGGTYWSFETESLGDMRKAFRQQAWLYATGMLSFRPDLAAIRHAKLQNYVDAAPRSEAEIRAEEKRLYDADAQLQIEVLKGMIEGRTFQPGLSYRGTGEISGPGIDRANEKLAVLQLAEMPGGMPRLAAAKQQELAHLLGSLDSYVHNDVGFRLNTYTKSEVGLPGTLYSGLKMDARTNADRAKV